MIKRSSTIFTFQNTSTIELEEHGTSINSNSEYLLSSLILDCYRIIAFNKSNSFIFKYYISFIIFTGFSFFRSSISIRIGFSTFNTSNGSIGKSKGRVTSTTSKTEWVGNTRINLLFRVFLQVSIFNEVKGF